MADSLENISKLKTLATLWLVPIERPNVQAVTIIGTIVAQELRDSGKWIKYRKEIEKNFPPGKFNGIYLETKNLSHLGTSANWKT